MDILTSLGFTVAVGSRHDSHASISHSMSIPQTAHTAHTVVAASIVQQDLGWCRANYVLRLSWSYGDLNLGRLDLGPGVVGRKVVSVTAIILGRR